MTEKRHGQPKATEPADSDGLYEELPALTVKDSVGVVVALLLLALVGGAGYIWLTPGLSFTTLWPDRGKDTAIASTMSPNAMLEELPVTPPPLVDAEIDAGARLALPDPTADARCEYCGMFAHKSLSRIAIYWSDNSLSQHDCWDCMLGWSADEELTLAKAFVFQHDADEPHWLNAEESWFLYDTKQIEGSMPPFVAAFETDEAARAAQPELGGEIVDFTGLMAKWEW